MEELEVLGPDGEAALEETAATMASLLGGCGSDSPVPPSCDDDDHGHRNSGPTHRDDGASSPEEPEAWDFLHDPVRIHEPLAGNTSDDVEIGNQIWNAGILLARVLDEGLLPDPYRTSMTHILELGCGTGITAVVAARSLPSSVRITATNFHPSILATAMRNMDANDVADRVDVRQLDWNDPPSSDLAEGVDCILAADVVYDHRHARLLPDVMRRIFRASSAPVGRVVILNRIRDQFLAHVAEFEVNMARAGFKGGWQWVDELFGDAWKGERR
ncbi:hypothetical protein HKX48_005053 [Thoreauomyces humboldtii]|nr:hypothetical protein HKX48_005053 [Thoreauomyces humboldtii]